MTVSSSTPSHNITPDVNDSAPEASVSHIMGSINSTLRSEGGIYTDYSCKTVSWDDVTRGTVGDSLSCWGANITDTRLYAKSGRQLYTVRSDNWNEKVGRVSAHELALVSGNQQHDGKLTPITLHDFLRDMGKQGSYAGIDPSVRLDDPADASVSVRFMTTFLPVAEERLSTLEFAPEMYQYQTRSDTDPANVLVLATTQGVAVQANGSGATKLYHHAVEPGKPGSKRICRYWFEAERSDKKVGGAQHETKEEALAAAQRGKATASVIGVRAMGTRFNVLMTIQVPLVQQPVKYRWRSIGVSAKASCCKKSIESFEEEEYEEEECVFDEDESDSACESECEGAVACSPMMSTSMLHAPPAARHLTGKANAARVSRGSLVDRVEKTIHVPKPRRDGSQHVTVTIVIYNTVAGGVPSAQDVKAAVDDMEALYASCGWNGRLASSSAAFMKKELTGHDVNSIADNLKTQPYMPPVGQNLVAGGAVFPTSASMA